jgi:GNAT superfamily N-acetyltransferase
MSFQAPVLLDATHQVEAFDCGHEALNAWLKRHALANQALGASRTFVVTSGTRVVAYYALAAGSVNHLDATGKLRRNMPDPIPVALIARLAVDRSAQRFGLGAALLRDALLRIHQASQNLGIRGVLVDAIDDTAAQFYEHHGFRPSAAIPHKLMITLNELERLLP